MEEPLLAEHRARGRYALGALAGDPQDSAPIPHQEEGAKKIPLQPHEERGVGNLKGNDTRAAPNPHQEKDTKKSPLQAHEERGAGNESSTAQNPRQEENEDAKKSLLQAHEERGAGNESSTAPNPRQEEDEDAKKTSLSQPPETNGLLCAEKPPLSQLNEKKAPPLCPTKTPPLCPKKQAKNPRELAPVNSAKKPGLDTLTMAGLTEQARGFAQSAAGTSMAAAADALCSAAEQFACGKGRKRKVIETDLNQAAMIVLGR